MVLTIDEFKQLFRRKKKKKGAPRSEKVDSAQSAWSAMQSDFELLKSNVADLAQWNVPGADAWTKRLEETEQAADDGEYALARELLLGLIREANPVYTEQKEKKSDLEDFYAERESRAKEVLGIVDNEVSVALRGKKAAFKAVHDDFQRDFTTFQFDSAKSRKSDFDNKLDDAYQGKLDHDREKREFGSKYGAWKYKAERIVNYPDRKIPDWLVRAKRDAASAIADINACVAPTNINTPEAFDYALAKNRVDALATIVRNNLGELESHDKEKRAYFAHLTKLAPRIEYARNLADDPAWHAEKVAFDAQKQKVVDAQNDHDYPKARKRLEKLETAIETLTAARLAALQGDIDGATTSDKVKTLVRTKLQEVEITALPKSTQVRLLATLRQHIHCDNCGKNYFEEELKGSWECPDTSCASTKLRSPALACLDCDRPWPNDTRDGDCSDPTCNGIAWVTNISPNQPELFEARCKMYKNVSMDPTFAREDRKKRDQLVSELIDDEEFINSKNSWEEWSRTDVSEKQKNANLKKKIAFLTSVVKKQCKILGHPVPELIFKDKGPNGSDGSTASPPDGKPGTPCKITINTGIDSFNDFMEVLDTVVHENVHAYQMSLVYDKLGIPPLDPPKLKEGDPEYWQAKMFWENEKGYVKSDQDYATYLKEPLEDHAWPFGRSVSSALNLPITRGNELLEIESATQANPVQVTFKKAHALRNGEKIYIYDVAGMVDLNDNMYEVVVVSPKVVILKGVNGRAYGAHTANTGKARIGVSEKELTV